MKCLNCGEYGVCNDRCICEECQKKEQSKGQNEIK